MDSNDDEIEFAEKSFTKEELKKIIKNGKLFDWDVGTVATADT